MSDIYAEVTISITNEQDTGVIFLSGILTEKVLEELLPYEGGSGEVTPTSYYRAVSLPINIYINYLKTDPRLLDYLPWYYKNSYVANKILKIHERVLNTLTKNIEDTQAQAFVSTATWGLDWYEELLGLHKFSFLSDEQRRERILQKIAGFGMATRGKISAVIKGLVGQDVVVLEDYKNQSVIVSGVSDIDIIRAVRDLVRKVIPAHLQIIYFFMIWDFIDNLNTTWDEFDSMYLTWNELEGLYE